MQEQVSKIEKQVNEMHSALMGTKYGQKGLVERVDGIEKYQMNDKKQKWTIAGVGISLGFILKFWDKIHW